MPEDVPNGNMITLHVSRNFRKYFLDIFTPMYKMPFYKGMTGKQGILEGSGDTPMQASENTKKPTGEAAEVSRCPVMSSDFIPSKFFFSNLCVPLTHDLARLSDSAQIPINAPDGARRIENEIRGGRS